MFRRTRPPAVEPPESSKRGSDASGDGKPQFPPNTIVREPGLPPVAIAIAVLLFLGVVGVSVYFMTQGKSATAQVAEAKPATVTRVGKVIRKDTAVHNNIHYFYLAFEVDNNGKNEVVSLYATGERLEVPMMVVGDTVTFTTKVGEEEVTTLRIDWSKRPELAK